MPRPNSSVLAINEITFTIPKSLPSGQYLLRGEQVRSYFLCLHATADGIFDFQIALHVASTYGGAQFYLACAQINVVNGGSGNPGPLVAFPGAYTGVSSLSNRISPHSKWPCL